MGNNGKSSYRSILGATSLFGGVQVFKILIKIVQSKFVAVLLGTSGIGIVGLYSSGLGLVQGLTEMGVTRSAVKNVAAQLSKDGSVNDGVVQQVITVRWLVWATGGLGMVVVLLAAPWLSKWSFGDESYTWAFQILSVTLLINQVSAGQKVIFQGMRKLGFLAQASIYGSLLALLITVPLYYLYGKDGIVPVILLTASIQLLLSYYFSRKIQLPAIQFDWTKLRGDTTNILSLGLAMMAGTTLLLINIYAIRVFVSRTGSISEVGLYTAGTAMISTYVEMIFSAMGTDYFPRLSRDFCNVSQRDELINQQAEIAFLLLGPILTAFILFSEPVITLLYSSRFLPIVGMICVAAVGVLFKAACWPVGFLPLAAGDSRTFLWVQISANVLFLLMHLLGYYLYGLTGLGLGYLATYGIHVFVVNSVGYHKYDFHYGKSVLVLFFIQFAFILAALAAKFYLDSSLWSYGAGSLILLLASWYGVSGLNKRVGVRETFDKLSQKYRRRN